MSDAQFSPIDSAPGYKRVADAIEREILAGRLATGELLPTEHALAAQLGVNRSTVREGIRALENAGLIRRAGAKRLVVSVPDSHEIARTASRALGLSGTSFLALWEVQMAMEPFAAGLAAARATPDQIAALEDNLARTEACLADDRALVRLDVEFHRLVAEATGNGALVLAGEPIGMLLLSATRELYQRAPQARGRLVEAHRRILAAIATGDEDTARTWMLKHIRDFRRGYAVAGLDLTASVVVDPAALGRRG